MTTKTQLLTTLFLLAVTVGIGVPHHVYAEESELQKIWKRLKEITPEIEKLEAEAHDVWILIYNSHEVRDRIILRAEFGDLKSQIAELKIEKNRLEILAKVMSMSQDPNFVNYNEDEMKYFQSTVKEFENTYHEWDKEVATPDDPTKKSDGSNTKHARASTTPPPDIVWDITSTRDNKKCLTIDPQTAKLSGTIDFVAGKVSKLVTKYDFPEKIYEKQGSRASCQTFDFIKANIKVYEVKKRSVNWCVQEFRNNDASLSSLCTNISKDALIVVTGNGWYGDEILPRGFSWLSMGTWEKT